MTDHDAKRLDLDANDTAATAEARRLRVRKGLAINANAYEWTMNDGPVIDELHDHRGEAWAPRLSASLLDLETDTTLELASSEWHWGLDLDLETGELTLGCTYGRTMSARRHAGIEYRLADAQGGIAMSNALLATVRSMIAEIAALLGAFEIDNERGRFDLDEDTVIDITSALDEAFAQAVAETPKYWDVAEYMSTGSDTVLDIAEMDPVDIVEDAQAAGVALDIDDATDLVERAQVVRDALALVVAALPEGSDHTVAASLGGVEIEVDGADCEWIGTVEIEADEFDTAAEAAEAALADLDLD